MLRWLGSRRAPWFVSWALTFRCNYRCGHCGYWREQGAELTADRALDHARQMVRAGVWGVSLCGGEVLLRPELGQILEILHRGGVVTRVTTNGRLVPQRLDDLRWISRLKLSLDGPPEVHDLVRGPGAFADLQAALAAARRAGIPVQLNSVLGRPLLERLDEHLQTVARLGASVTFQPPERRPGAAPKALDELLPTPGQMSRAVDRLAALRRAGDRRVGNSAGTLAYIKTWPEPAPVDCHAGRRFCRIMPDGRVLACDRPQAPAVIQAANERQSTVEPGFTNGIVGLRRAGTCAGCWRNNTIEINRALSGAQGAVRAVLRMR